MKMILNIIQNINIDPDLKWNHEISRHTPLMITNNAGF